MKLNVKASMTFPSSFILLNWSIRAVTFVLSSVWERSVTPGTAPLARPRRSREWLASASTPAWSGRRPISTIAREA